MIFFSELSLTIASLYLTILTFFPAIPSLELEYKHRLVRHKHFSDSQSWLFFSELFLAVVNLDHYSDFFLAILGLQMTILTFSLQFRVVILTFLTIERYKVSKYLNSQLRVFCDCNIVRENLQLPFFPWWKQASIELLKFLKNTRSTTK